MTILPIKGIDANFSRKYSATVCLLILNRFHIKLSNKKGSYFNRSFFLFSLSGINRSNQINLQQFRNFAQNVYLSLPRVLTLAQQPLGPRGLPCFVHNVKPDSDYHSTTKKKSAAGSNITKWLQLNPICYLLMSLPSRDHDDDDNYPAIYLHTKTRFVNRCHEILCFFCVPNFQRSTFLFCFVFVQVGNSKVMLMRARTFAEVLMTAVHRELWFDTVAGTESEGGH